MMKNIFRFVLILGLFIFATSAYAEIYEEDGYIGPLEYHNEYRYHKVKKIALCTYIFQKYGKYGILIETHNKDNTVNAKIKIPPIYDKIEVLGLGYIGVSLDGKWGVRESRNDYPRYNKIVVPIEWDYVEKFGDVSNEIFIVKRNDKFGLVNSKNEMLLDVELDSIFQLSPSKTFAYTKNENEKYGLINKLGNILTEPIWDKANGIDVNTVSVCKESGCGVYDSNGQEVFAPVYDWDFVERPSGVPEGYLVTRKNGNYGLMDIEERIILDNEFPYINAVKPYGAEMKMDTSDKKYKAVANINTGKYIVQLMYDKVEYWDNYGYYKVKENGKWGAIDSQGDELYPTEYGPFEINRMIKKHPIDTGHLETVSNNELHQLYLRIVYNLKVGSFSQAKRLLKKLVAKNNDMVQDLVYKYNIDPTF